MANNGNIRGVGELPINGTLSRFERRILGDIRQNQNAQVQAQVPPRVPVGLKVTAQAFSNLVQFVRTDGDYYEVLWSNTPDISKAVLVNIGSSQHWTDNVGQSGVKRFYWVRAVRALASRQAIRSPVTASVSATTLASGTGVTPPPNPTTADQQVLDYTTGKIVPNLPNA